MARIRTIKPEFFTDSKVLALTPLARLFYVSLWCEADRAGRLKWDPVSLKYRYLPADKAKVEDLGEELLEAKLIRLYEIDGATYADIPGFLKHQVINNRESESSFPAFSSDACGTRESGVSDAACGKEGREGKEGTTPIVPKGTKYPEDFQRLVGAYPKRQGTNPLPTAWKAYNAALARGATIDQLVAAAQAYGRTEVAGTKFCQQLATWLNGDEWLNAGHVGATDAGDPAENLWKARASNWKPGKYWNRDQWGPAPFEPGCRVPSRFLPSKTDGFDPERDIRLRP